MRTNDNMWTTKGGEQMPPKKGVTYNVEHKDTRIFVRLTEEEVKTLDDICKRDHKTRSDVVRKGIEMQK